MNDPMTTDEVLLDRFANKRDRAAAAELAARYQDCIYDLTFRILRNAADAGDATQATFLNALRGAAGFRKQSSVKTWIYGIAIHESLRMRNQRKRTQRWEDSMDSAESRMSSTNGRQELMEREARAAVEREVDTLPEHERLAVVLHYWRGLSYGETAEVLGCASGTIGSRLAAAREKLKARLATLGMAAAVPGVEELLTGSAMTPAPDAVRASIVKLLTTAIPSAAAVPALSGWGAWTVVGSIAAAAVASTIWFTRPLTPADKASVASAAVIARTMEPEHGTALTSQDTAPARVEAKPAADVKPSVSDRAATFRVSGVVKDQKSGLPIAGASVAIYRIWPPMPAAQVKGVGGPFVETNQEGGYRWEESVAGAALYRIEIVDPSLAKGNPFEYVVMQAFLDGIPHEVAKNWKFIHWTQLVKLSLGPWAPFQVVEALESRDARVDFEVLQNPSKEARVQLLTEPNAALVAGLRRVFVKEKTPSIFGMVQAEDGSHPRDVQLRIFDKDGVQDWTNTVVLHDFNSGEFVAGPLPPGPARVEAIHAERGYAVAQGLQVSPSGPLDNLVLTLRRGSATYAGVVVNTEGQPVPGARVHVYPESLLDGGAWLPAAAEAMTGKDGSFTIAGAGTPGEFLRVRVDAREYRPGMIRGAAAGDNTARLVVKRKAYVKGRIVSKATGKPIEVNPPMFGFLDIDVTPHDPTPRLVKGTFQTAKEAVHLDSNGGFSVEARPGANDIRVSFQGYAAFVRTNVLVEDDGLDLGTIELEPVNKR